jgi:hypothetical protein
MGPQNRATVAKGWQPLRVALAWRVTYGDREFVDLVREDANIDDPDILADCLRKEMVGWYDEKGFQADPARRVGPLVVNELERGVEITHTGRISGNNDGFYTPRRGPSRSQEVLAKSWTGRLQRVAEDFEAARCARPNQMLPAADYLKWRFEQALRETCTLIADGKVRAKWIPVHSGVEDRMRKVRPSEISEHMILREDGLLYQSANKSAPAWKSLYVWWGDFMQCRGGAAAAESTAAKIEQALSDMTAPEEVTASTEQGREPDAAEIGSIGDEPSADEPARPVLPPRMDNILQAVRAECKERGHTSWIKSRPRQRDDAIWSQFHRMGIERETKPGNLQSFQRVCREFFRTFWPSVRSDVEADIPGKSGQSGFAATHASSISASSCPQLSTTDTMSPQHASDPREPTPPIPSICR